MGSKRGVHKYHHGAIVGVGDYSPVANSDAYETWYNILDRCYSPFMLAKHPTYKGCTVCEAWMNFQVFAKWYYANKKYDGWQIDKDILCKGNRTYSPDTCGFIPEAINKMIIYKKKANGLPVGVFRKPRYNKRGELTHYDLFSSCKNGNKQVHLGYFDTPEEAHAAYKTYKEQLMRNMAEKYKGQLDERMYNAIKNYQV